MKISLDKETITFANVEAAKQFAKENDWIGKDELRQCADLVIRKYHSCDYNLVDEIISLPRLEVIYQGALGFGIYAHNMIVKYWHKDGGEKFGYKIAIIGTNITECLAGNVSGWVQIFANTADKVI